MTGTLVDVRAVADLVDSDARLPHASLRCEICGRVTGHNVVSVVSHLRQTIRCRGCADVCYAGEQAATIQVYEVEGTAVEAWCHVSTATAREINAAKAVPPAERTERQTILARVWLPIPKSPYPS